MGKFMQKENLNFFKRWFLNYADQFCNSDNFIQNNIKRKIEHTAMVCENILLLAKSECLDEEGCRLAETIALFHDLGRFEQFNKYKTFKDSDSENHALLGTKILKRKGILSRLSLNEKNLVIKAVEYHNLREIPECTIDSKELLFYSKLIRDADKLDILKLACENCNEGETVRNPAFYHNLLDTPVCSKSVIKDILNNKIVDLNDVKNLNDIKLLRLSFVFDINFPLTISIIKEQKYIKKIASSIPSTKEIYNIMKHLESYLNATGCDSRKTYES